MLLFPSCWLFWHRTRLHEALRPSNYMPFYQPPRPAPRKANWITWTCFGRLLFCRTVLLRLIMHTCINDVVPLTALHASNLQPSSHLRAFTIDCRRLAKACEAKSACGRVNQWPSFQSMPGAQADFFAGAAFELCGLTTHFFAASVHIEEHSEAAFGENRLSRPCA